MYETHCSFNKREEDFKDLDSYNNYLEDYENISKSVISLIWFQWRRR